MLRLLRAQRGGVALNLCTDSHIFAPEQFNQHGRQPLFQTSRGDGDTP